MRKIKLKKLHEKLESESLKAYIGLAGIKDFKLFWENFDNVTKKNQRGSCRL